MNIRFSKPLVDADTRVDEYTESKIVRLPKKSADLVIHTYCGVIFVPIRACALLIGCRFKIVSSA